MRRHGTLTRWNEARGFGFIEPAQGTHELFVHVSAFPRGEQPVVGQMLSFTVVDGSDGRPRAIDVRTPGSASRTTERRPPPSSTARSNPVRAVAALVLVLVAGAVVYGRFAGSLPWPSVDRAGARSADVSEPVRAMPAAASAASLGFRCDGRTHCSQMRSCDEATFFLKHCPTTEMDGDGDGIPCERQWCGHVRF